VVNNNNNNNNNNDDMAVAQPCEVSVTLVKLNIRFRNDV
jgi:hypothetical protein